jgi:hypothetical protein
MDLVDLDLGPGRREQVAHDLERGLEAGVGAATAGAGREVEEQEVDSQPIRGQCGRHRGGHRKCRRFHLG